MWIRKSGMLLSAALILLATAGSVRAQSSSGGLVLGDVNLNGKLDLVDAILALRFAIGAQDPSPLEATLADVAPANPDGTIGDGKVDLRDAITILKATIMDGTLPPLTVGGISGRIIDSSIVGIVVPIAGATVAYTSTESTVPLATSTTDRNGWYLIRNIPPGNYRVAAVATNYNPADKSPIAVAANKVARVDLALDPAGGGGSTNLNTGVITGKVVDTSIPGYVQPIAGATVAYRTADNPNPIATTTTGADGTYSFTNVVPGVYLLGVLADKYVQQITPKTITVTAQKTIRQDFVMDRAHGPGGGSFLTATITARIVDQSIPGVTIPVVGATVGYRTADSPMPVATAVTDPDGWFFFGNVPPGVYSLAVVADKYAQATTQSFSVLPGTAWPLGDNTARLLTLARAHGDGGGTFDTLSLTGRVIDQSTPGATIPVVGATVAYRDPVTQAVVASVVTDSQGYYWFGKVQPGTYQIAVVAPNYMQTLTKAQTLPPGVTASLDIQLQPAHGPGGGSLATGTLTGRIIDQTIPGATLPVAGATVGYRTLDNPVPVETVQTDADGWYYFPNVRPGQYQIAVIATRYNQTTTKSFTLSIGTTVQTDVPLTVAQGTAGTSSFTAATITGQVFDTTVAGVRPTIAGATVTYRAVDGLVPLGTTTTDANGWYRFPNVQPGQYRLDAWADGYTVDTSLKLTVPVGTTTYDDFGLKKQ